MKKRILTILLVFILAAAAGPASLSAYASENSEENTYVDSPDDPDPWNGSFSHELEYISIYSLPYKTVYSVGETLDSEGLVLVLYYADGDELLEYEGYVCTPYTLRYAGSQWIDVEYGGLYTGFNVSVVDNSEISSIEIYQMPDRLQYEPGETLDMTGLKIQANYTDGRAFVTSSRFTCSPATLKTEGIQTITVSYEGCTVTFDVTVGDPNKVTGISLASPPDKTEYTVGEAPDLSGLRITVSSGKGDETIDAANSNRIRVSPETFAETGQQTVTVTYTDEGEFSCEFPVQVAESAEPEIVEDVPEEEPAPKTANIVWLIPVLAAAVLIAYALYILTKYKDALAGKSLREILSLEHSWRRNRKQSDEKKEP